jgi:hypothetical protein
MEEIYKPKRIQFDKRIANMIVIDHIVYDEYPSDKIKGDYFDASIENFEIILSDPIITEIFNNVNNGVRIQKNYRDILERSKIIYKLNSDDVININKEDRTLNIDYNSILKICDSVEKQFNKIIDNGLNNFDDLNYLYCGFVTQESLHAIGIIYQKNNDESFPYLVTISNSGDEADRHGINDNNGTCNAILQFKITRDKLISILVYSIVFRKKMSVECFYVHLIKILLPSDKQYFTESPYLTNIIYRELQNIGNCSTLSMLTPLVLLTKDNTQNLSADYKKIYNSLKIYGIYVKLEIEKEKLLLNKSRQYTDYREFLKLSEHYSLFIKDN